MWPNETPKYRQARDKLVNAEARLRAEAEAVAELRRELPDGGAAKQDYEFTDASSGKPVRLSQLFATGKNSLFLYNFMFAPGKDPCPMCTSLLDGLNGQAPHLSQRINVAAVAKAKPGELRAFSKKRGWKNLRLLSSHANSYNRDYRGETPQGEQNPMMHVWTRRGGEVRHFWASELFGHKGGDWTLQPRHADAIWPLWNVLDLTPEGRGKNWYPKLAY